MTRILFERAVVREHSRSDRSNRIDVIMSASGAIGEQDLQMKAEESRGPPKKRLRVAVEQERSEENKKDYRRKCCYVSSFPLRKISDRLSAHKGRASVVHALIQATQLVDKMKVVEPRPATAKDLAAFHDTAYIETMLRASDCDDNAKSISLETLEKFGLLDDCFVFPKLSVYISAIAGASLTAAKELCSEAKKDQNVIVFCWTGGRHHAHRNKASGFCYVNDVVLSILKMKQTFPKILYVDVDVHHGDGVERAFNFSDEVFTLSFHSYGDAFFPGTGSYSESGKGRGKCYSMNVPLRSGISDAHFVDLFEFVFGAVASSYGPDAIVLVCGADTLSRDPLGNFNMTVDGITRATKCVFDFNVPTLVLGGGGYKIPDVARCWTAVTAAALNAPLPADVPVHDYFPAYAPSYRMRVDPSNARKDLNTPNEIAKIKSSVKASCEKLREKCIDM